MAMMQKVVLASPTSWCARRWRWAWASRLWSGAGTPAQADGRARTTRGLCAGIRFDAGDDIVEETLERALRTQSKEEKEAKRNAALLTTRREAVHLYRFVWRCSRLFVHTNENGEVWRDVLRRSARDEFEAARHEADPAVITKLLVSGRDFCEQAVRRFMERRDVIQKEEDGRR